MQQVLSEAASKPEEQAVAFIPIPEAAGVADNYESLYPTQRWKDPVSYIQSTAVIEEYTSAGLAEGCTYYMDERDKEWLDRNNEGARGEGTSAQGSVLTSSGRVSARSAKAKGKEPEELYPIPMSEDEFELVMGLFEKITQEKTEFLHHVRLLLIGRACPDFFPCRVLSLDRSISQISLNTNKFFLCLCLLTLLHHMLLPVGYPSLPICFALDV